MTPARYHGLRDRVLRGVDHVFAEPVLLRPVANGSADQTRPTIEIEAVLRVEAGKAVAVSGRGVDVVWNSRVDAQGASLHIDRARYRDIVVRTGDEVRALSRPGQPWFEIVGVDDRGMTRLVLDLAETA